MQSEVVARGCAVEHCAGRKQTGGSRTAQNRQKQAEQEQDEGNCVPVPAEVVFAQQKAGANSRAADHVHLVLARCL
jgi:hypothetical protein